MENKKRSFFERLTGSVQMDDDKEEANTLSMNKNRKSDKSENSWIEEENEEAELAIDMYQTPRDIVIETMVAGVKPDDLELSIARDMVTIRGKREESRSIDEANYFTKELYWGTFSRTISLPHEVEPEEVEAIEKHGLLTIKIQKVNKEKTNTVKIKSI